MKRHAFEYHSPHSEGLDVDSAIRIVAHWICRKRWFTKSVNAPEGIDLRAVRVKGRFREGEVRWAAWMASLEHVQTSYAIERLANAKGFILEYSRLGTKAIHVFYEDSEFERAWRAYTNPDTCLAAFGVECAASTPSPQSQGTKVQPLADGLVASRLILDDAGGKTRAVLDVQGLFLCDAFRGLSKAILAVAPGAHSSLALHDEQFSERAELRVGEEGDVALIMGLNTFDERIEMGMLVREDPYAGELYISPGLRLHDGDALEPRVELGIDERGTPSLVMRDSKDVPRLDLMAKDGFVGLALFDRRGMPRASLAQEPEGARLIVQDGNGKVIARQPATLLKQGHGGSES